MNWLYLTGRILFGLIFLSSGMMGHLVNLEGTAQWTAAQGVPAAKAMVVITGLMILAGSISVILGYLMEIGTWLLIIFLVVVAVIMHNFWVVADPMLQGMQQAHFMKNLSMAGGAMILFWLVKTHGYGPMTLGRPIGRRAIDHSAP